MDNIKSYESIAREAGFDVATCLGVEDVLQWYKKDNYDHRSKWLYQAQEEAWKACCVENGLV